MAEKNAHCSYCGHRYAARQPWPRTCAGCGQTSYVNPIPVAVLLLQVDGGLVVIRRAIPPRQGSLALPGGYINLGESWQHAACRELFEETGIRVAPETVADFRTLSAPDGTVLVFGLAQLGSAADLPPFAASDETSERLILRAPEELGFSLHTQVVREFFARKT
jgi:ADP-ribose pyrophosphatase YjhB (NUDIX family)